MTSTTSTTHHADNTAAHTTNSSPGFFQNMKNALTGSSHNNNNTNTADGHNNNNNTTTTTSSSHYSTSHGHHDHNNTSTNLHPGLDRGINHVRSHNMNTTKLTQALEQYAQQSAALKQTGNTVAAAFQACLANDSGPYTELANEFAAAHLQLISVNPPMPDRIIRESQSDFDARHQRVDSHVTNLTKLRGRVQHYVDKVNKLRADRDQRMASDKPLTQQELEKLERNILKARTAEQNYNTANSQLIEELNGLHIAPVQHLGPALVAFIGAEQIYAAQSNALLSKIQMDAAALNNRSQSWLAAQQPLIAPGTGIITNPSLDSVERVDINHPVNAAAAHQQRASAHTSTNTNSVSTTRHSRNDSVDSVNDALGTTMIRSEEQFRVGTERVEFERIVMKKYVTSEVINVQVTVRKEHLTIDRLTLNNNNNYNNNSNNNNSNNNMNLHNNNNTYNNNNTNTNNFNNTTTSTVGAPMGVPSTTALPSSNANTTVSGEWEFILSSEQPVVTTRVVPYERVRVRKITDRAMERVGADLRKENIDFTLAPTQHAQQNAAGAQVLMREHPGSATQQHMVGAAAHQSMMSESENVDGNGFTGLNKHDVHAAHTHTGYEKTDDFNRLNNTNTVNTANNASLVNTGAPQPRGSLV